MLNLIKTVLLAAVVATCVIHTSVYYYSTSTENTKIQTVLRNTSKISKLRHDLVIVSDISSHFGKEIAITLAEMGFYILAGVHTESDRKAYTGYNAIKGLETVVLNVADPMDIVQLTYRAQQISQKYGRALYAAVIVDTYSSRDYLVPTGQWKKQRKLQEILLNENNSTSAASLLTWQERDELFHMNTLGVFDMQPIHVDYQNMFQGPYRLVQACYDMAVHMNSSMLRISYLRPFMISNRLPLFSQDIVKHLNSFLSAKEYDATALDVPSETSLSVIEYAQFPSSIVNQSATDSKRIKTKNTKKKVKKDAQPLNKMSTTTTLSAIPVQVISDSVIHSLLAEKPFDLYRLGNLKISLAIHDSSDPYGHEARRSSNDETCSSRDEERNTLTSIKNAFMWMLHRLPLHNSNSMEYLSSITLPLLYFDTLFTYVLPPVVSEYVWHELIVPRVVLIL